MTPNRHPLQILAALVIATGCLFSALAPQQAFGQTDEKPTVNARLLCDYQTIAPGQTFNLAMQFDIADHWHIYWRNPGDSGMPTKLTVTTPSNFKAGPVRYPLPSIIPQPGGTRVIGYEKQTMLIIPVTAPDDLKPGQSFKFTVRAEWLSCKDVCVIGGDEQTITLPAAKKPKPADDATQKRIDKYKAQLPQAAGPLNSPVGFVISIPEPLGRSYRLNTTLSWNEDVKVLHVLPVPDDQVIAEKPVVKHKDKQTQIITKAVVLPARKPDAGPMPALVIYQDAKGQTHGVNIEIKLPAP